METRIFACHVQPMPRFLRENALSHDNSDATDGMMHRLPSLGLVYDA
jgi:hypothetical protein